MFTISIMHRLYLVFLFFSLTNGQSLSEFKSGYQKFSNELYTQASSVAAPAGNFLISPFSAANILTLTALGTKGLTYSELQNVLHLPNNQTDTKQVYKTITSTLATSDVKISDRIYPNVSLQIKEGFKETAAEVFNSQLQKLDYRNPTSAAAVINQHVSDDTNGKITNIIKPDDLKHALIVLVNALYYQGNWSVPFHLSTNQQPFYTSTKTIKVDTMFVTSKFNYQNNRDLDATIVQLKLVDPGVSVHIVLPNNRNGLATVEDRIRNNGYNPRFTSELVALSLPKFKIETSIDLTAILQSLGLRQAFVNGDFTGMFDVNNRHSQTYISRVLQKTYLKVNEAGTEVAGSTVVVGQLRPTAVVSWPVSQPIDVTVDHPFRFFIFVDDIELFSGRVLNPQE